MPIYNLNNRVYDIPDDVVKEFEKDNPTATMAYQDGEDIYDIQVNQKEEFLKQFPKAKLYVEQPASMGTQEEDNALFEANMERLKNGQPIERVTTQSLLDASKDENGIPDSELKRLKDIHDNAQKQIDESSFFDRFFNENTRTAVATRNKAEEALELYEEANREKENWFDRNVVGVMKGFADKFGDLSTWDFGASGFASAKTLNDISTKLESGEPLSAAEQNMLDAYGLASAVQSAYQDKVGMAYRVGGSLPESMAFGASLAINPAGGVGKKLAETAAKAAVKKYGKTLASKLAKGAARVGGDVLEMGVATAIPGAGRVAEDYYNRMNGQSTFDIDENGIIRYGGQVDQEEADDAIWKAFGSQFIENYSEAMGNYFAPMGNMISSLTAKGLKAAHLGKFADVVSDISSSQFSKGLQRFKQATKFDGLVGEYLEEVAGNVINAATVGDMNFNSPEDPRSVFNPETNIETFLSCALLSGTMYAVEAPVSIYNKNVAKRNLNKADNAAKELWGDRWDDMRSQMDEADPHLLAQLLTGVQNASDLSDEQKQAAKNYGMRLMQYQGYNARRLQNEAESTSDANEINNAYDEGSDLQTPYDKHSAKRAADKAEAALGNDAEFVKAVMDGASSPVATINAMAESGKYTEEQIQEAKDYYSAMNRMNGMTDALLDEVDSQIESANVEVDMNTNKNTGVVTKVVLRGGELGYVIEGSVVGGENGKIDTNGSDDLVVVRLEGGEVKMMNPNKDLAGVAWTESPEKLKNENNTVLRQSLIDNGIQEIDWNPATPNPKVGDSFEMDGISVTIVSNDGNGGMFVVPSEEWQAAQGNEKKQQELISKAQQMGVVQAGVFKQWASDQLDAQEEAAALQEEAAIEEAVAEEVAAEEVQAVEESDSVKEKRPMTEDEAAEFIFKMERNAVEAPEIELTPENWIAEFGEDGLVETPIGQVKFGQNQYVKLQQMGRNGKLGMIKPTLINPDIIIEDKRPSKNGEAERDFSYVFIKAFTGKDGKRMYYFTSVTVKKDGSEVVISNQEKSINKISKLLQNGNVAWTNSLFSSHPTTQIEKSVPLNDSNKPTSTDNQPALLGINSSELSINKDNKENVQSQENTAKPLHEREKEEVFRELGEKYGEKMPNKIAVTAKAFADDLKKAQNEIDKAQDALDNAPIGRDSKQQAALDKAKAYYEAVKREADFWAEMDADIKAAQAQRESILNPQAEINVSQEPITADEFIAQQIANGSIAFVSDSYKKETGYGEEERKKFVKMFRKAENGGLTIEEAGELLMQIDRENGTNFFDQEDANAGRDAIINFLGSVRSWGDITGYIKNNRRLMAEKESESLRNEFEDYLINNLHMTPEEYATALEMEMQNNPYEGVDVAAIDAIFAEAEEQFINEQKYGSEGNVDGNSGESELLSQEQVGESVGDNASPTNEQAEGVGGRIKAEGETSQTVQSSEVANPQIADVFAAAEQIDAEEKRRRPLRQRANEWAKALGVKVTFIERIEDVDARTRTQIESSHSKGDSVPGWVAKNGEVFFFMPDLRNINDVNDTYVHEVVAHKGLKEMLGIERFNELCDKVWEMMPTAERVKYMAYPGVKNNRDAADEYMAFLSEKQNLTPEQESIWDKIVQFFRELFDQKLNGILAKSKLTNEDISNLIKASYANLKSGKNEGAVSSEDNRFSIKFSTEEQSIIDKAKSDGTYMKAPNGQPTKLNEKQWAQVRTKAFKKWFGDWENDSANASKIVDENGEPLVLRHRTPNEFTEFDKGKIGSTTDYGAFGLGFYFSPSDFGAWNYGQNMIEAFLNIKNPLVLNSYNAFDIKEPFYGENYKWGKKQSEKFTEWVKENGHDGVHYDYDGKHDEMIAFEPNQIKSATDNVGTFDEGKNDMRFRVVYHGSGAEFDKFNHEKMGTGAGSQVFGWGTYVTESEQIGRDYANIGRKATDDDIKYIGDFGEYVGNDIITVAKSFLRDADYNLDKAKGLVSDYLSKNVPESTRKGGEFLLGTNENDWTYNLKRHFYEVEIPDEKRGNYIVWGNNVTDAAAKKVFDSIYDRLASTEEYDTQTAQKELRKELDRLKDAYGQGKSGIWKDLYGDVSSYLGSDKDASLFLRSLGYVGIKYPAGTIYKGNYGGAHNFVIFDENDLQIVQHTRFRVYKSKDGKETKYKQLSLFDERGEAVNDGNRPDNIQRKGDFTLETLNHLRELQEGEICNVERKFTESKEFSFTRGERIESAADVAYIFKSLEDEAIENSFVAVAKGDDVTVIHLGMGAQTQTVVDTTAIFAAVERLGADKIFFVHNHPTGNIKCSRQDVQTYQALKDTFGDKLQDGIIINTRSGKYGLFNSSGLVDDEGRIKDEKNEYPISVYKFNKQSFNVDEIPSVSPSSYGIAEFVSTQRLGKRDKINALLLNYNFGCVGNILIDSSKDTKAIVEKITNDAIAMGARQVVIYGRYPFVEVTDRNTNFVSYLSSGINKYSQGNINLLDIIQVGESYSKSANDEGIRFRVTTEKQKQIDKEYVDAVREGDFEKAIDLFREFTLSKAEENGVVPIDYAVGYRDHSHSSIAKQVKEEHPDAIAEAAYQMSKRVPKGSILVPMPSRTGKATYTIKLAEAIAKVTDSEVMDVLRGVERESVYESKKKGMRVDSSSLGLYTTQELPKGKNVVIIDNVIDRGITALAAVEAVKGGSVLAYAFTKGSKERVASLKLSDPITYDDDMRIIPLSKRFDAMNDDLRFRIANRNQEIFVSNAQKAVEGIKQEKATPQQWLAMVEKNGGLKAGEDKWLGLSDWLKESTAKTITKDEVLNFINQNKIVIKEVHYGGEGMTSEDVKRTPDYKALVEDLSETDKDGNTFISKERYDYLVKETFDFKNGFKLENGQLEIRNPYAASLYLDIAPKLINSTRLDYTTEGLENKQEIALTIPTIESWNESDEIHFGDAGEGRAIAWIRFGETTIEDKELAEKSRILGTKEWWSMSEEERSAIKDELKELKQNSNPTRVLVIDEIQSKRHQEGREKGYKDYAKKKAFSELVDAMYDKYGANFNVKMTSEEEVKFDRLANERIQEDIRNDKKIPSAPFEKNWSELAMKRMLRYATENGFDKVAWTKGEQQAERYGLGSVINSIEGRDYEEKDSRKAFGKNRQITLYRNDGETALYVSKTDGRIYDYEGLGLGVELNDRLLSEVVGRELADKLMQEGDVDIPNSDLSIGGEGMKAFYDKMLPSFVNKYVKKWGTKVQDIELPNVEEAGRIMHSVDVTDAMKESVMEGQVMFRISDKGRKIQAEVDKFTSKYNSKSVNVVETTMTDEELMDAFENAFELEDVKSFMKESKTAAGYFHNLDKIVIFADRAKEERMEEYLFHENIHAAIHHNKFSNLVAYFYEYAKDAAEFERWNKLAHNKEYKKYNSSEEFLAYVVSNAMVARNLDDVANYLGDKQKDALNVLFNKLGYDYDIRRRSNEQPANRRTGKETSGQPSLEGNELQDTGARGRIEEGAGKDKSRSASQREQAERLKEFFDKVADMGLDGVLGNKRYGKLLMDIYNIMPDSVRKQVNEWAIIHYGGDFVPAMSDYLNKKATANIWHKVVGFVRETLRKAGFDLDLNSNDVKYMLWRSQKPMKRYMALDVAEDIDARRKFGVDGDSGVRFRVKNNSPFDPSDKRSKIVQEYDKFLKTGKFNFIEAFQDRMYSVKVLMDMIVDATGKKVRDFEDAYTAENQLGSINKPAEEKYLKNFYKPLVEAVKALSEKYGRDAVERYIYCKSGLERNEVLRQRDADEAYNDAKAELDEKLANNQIDQAQYNALLQQADDQRLKNLSEDVDYSGIRGMLYNIKAQAINKEFEEGKIDKSTRDARLSNLEANRKTVVKDWKKFAEDQVSAVENAANPAELKDLWKKINAATNETLRMDYESGMIDKDTYNAEKNMMKYYVPLRNWSDTTAEEMYEYRSELVRPVSSNQKRAKGRESQADNPIATIAIMAQNAIVRGNRNKVKQKFYAFVSNRETGLASVRDVWYVRDPNGDWVPQYADTTHAKDAAEFAQILDDFETNMQTLQAQGDAYKGRLPFGMKFRANRQQKQSHVVPVMINGKEYAVYVNGNPRPAQAMNGETNSEASNSSAWYDKIKRIYGAGLTSWNPDFIIPNMIRDGIHASTMTFLDAGPIAAAKFAFNGPRAFAQVFAMISGKGKSFVDPKNQAYFEEFVANGGETGYTAIHTLEDYKKEYDMLMDEVKGLNGRNFMKKGFEGMAKWLEAANRIFEDVNRFNAYVSARESGESIMRSINAAKNITVNFNKKGALSSNNTTFGTVANFMSKWILFFNPAVQGIEQLITKSKVNKGRAITIASTILASGFFMPMLNEMLVAAGGDDEEDDYWNQSDYKRRNNWLIFTGSGYVSIPLPPVLRELYGIGDIIYGSITGHITPERAAMDFARQVQSAVGFINLIPEVSQEPDMVTWAKGFAPDIAAPVLDVISNTNFMGRPIAKWTDFNEYEPEYERVYKGVSPQWVELSKLLNIVGGQEGRRSDFWGNFINPAMMEHLVTSYGGGIGKTINNLAGMAADLIKDDIENIDPYRKSPILPRFYTPNDEKTVVPAINRKYYDYDYMYNVAKKALKNYQEGVRSKEHPEYQKYIDGMKENGELEFIRFFENENKRLKRIQNLIKGEPTNKEDLEKRMIDIKAEIAAKCYEMLN